MPVAPVCPGAALVGGVVARSKNTTTALALLIAGAVLAVVGAVLGLTNNITSRCRVRPARDPTRHPAQVDQVLA